MKPLSVLLPACLLTAALTSPAAAMPDLVILVRHAERATQPAGDPGLTPAGEQRAQALAQALGASGIQAILTTQYRRTRDTAALLAASLGVQPQVVGPASGGAAGHAKAVAEAVKALTGNVLVVGHSNTVPAIIAALGGPQMAELCETSYHHLFVLQPGAQPRLLKLSYGEASGAPGANCL